MANQGYDVVVDVDAEVSITISLGAIRRRFLEPELENDIKISNRAISVILISKRILNSIHRVRDKMLPGLCCTWTQEQHF